MSFPAVSRLAGMDADSRVWIPGPLTSTMNLFAAAHAEWTGAERVDALDEATHAVVTPSRLRSLVTAGEPGLAGTVVSTAGDRLEQPVAASAARSGATVHHYYGAAELSFVAWGPHSGALRAFPEVRIVERAGELWVRSPYLCAAYLEPEHDLQRENGWMSVGDRGQVRDDMVTVHGRAGGITTAGATVLTSDIEQVLQRHSVGQVVVVGTPHELLGQVVTAILTDPQDHPTLRAASRAELTDGQRPRRWLLTSSFPMTSSGKLDRAAIAAQTRSMEVLP